jgi:pseudaminic acid synthase
MAADVEISGRPIGPDHPPYIVAEMSGNHNGDLDRALAIVEAAAAAGVDAVKLQTYTADTLTLDCDRPDFLIEGGLWAGRKLYELYQEAYTPWDWQERLFERGRELGLAVFSTPFDRTALEFLRGLDAPAYKVASFEVVDLPLVAEIASVGKPLVISTGMANLGEIAEAVETARSAGGKELILLHCISSYPTPINESNLETLQHLAQTFDVIVGLSDHTMGTVVSVAAVALGACFIEKHFTLRRDDGGPDAAFSLEPDELATLVRDCRLAWEARGRIDYSRKPSEAQNLIFRRSLYAVADIAEGEIFSDKNVRSIRPGYGLPPKFLPDVHGRKATRTIERGTPFDWTMVSAG